MLRRKKNKNNAITLFSISVYPNGYQQTLDIDIHIRENKISYFIKCLGSIQTGADLPVGHHSLPLVWMRKTSIHVIKLVCKTAVKTKS